MRRTVLAAATLLALMTTARPVHAEPPIHEQVIVKNATATIPPPPDCPVPASSIDLTFHLQLHITETAETFHLTQTLNGEFVSRDDTGAVVARGRVVSRDSVQAPGFPILVVTELIKSTGRNVAGDLVNITVLSHVTITANGDVAVTFDNVEC